MLENQLLAKTMNNDTKDNNLNPESEHKLFINLTPLDNRFFLKQRFRSRMLSKSVPLKSTSLFRHRMNRSLNFDIGSPRKNNLLKYSSSYLDIDSFDGKSGKSLRDLSRSAKIMRALSFNRDSFYHRNMNIKKSLNFDSSPSPQKTNNFDMGSPADSITDTSSSILDKSLRLDSSSSDSVASSMLVASLESIDENQNQTPQQNRKIAKLSSSRRINIEDINKSGSSSCSTSSLRSNLKEKIDNIIHTSQTPDLQSFKRQNRSRALGCNIVASTPRNLSQEFNQNEHNRPHTPDNVMHLIPESMSAIKKSHKKEKLYAHEERSFTQQKNVPAQNEDICTSLESIAMDISAIASCSRAFVKESQKKNKTVKKSLIYDSDDELFETRLIKHSAQQKTILKEKNSLGNRLNKIKNKIQDMDSSDCEKCEENIQDRDSTHLTNYDDKADYSAQNICDKNTCQSSLQKELSNVCNVNVMDENGAVFSEHNSTVSQNSNRATTPENNINIIEHIFTESIKKSHKKIKHENRKTSSKAKILYQKIETAQLETSVQNTFNDQCKDVKNEAIAVCVLSSQNADRPSTPENINSSRLLLSDFKSVKKSHKKDKYSKRISGLAKCHKYHHEYRKKYDNLLQDNRYEERNISKTLHKNESLEVNESLDVSPKKKKKSMNVSFESNVRKLYSSKSPSLRCNNTNDEFRIYTPTRKVISTSRFTVTNHADEILQEQDKPAQTTSKEIDCFRCTTPVARCLKKPRESEDFIYANTKKLEINTSVLSDGSADVADLKDKNGRSTPINMSTTELLCNIDSIKKSHKKDKHSRSICKRSILWKEESYIEKTAKATNMLKQHTSLKQMDIDNDCAKTGMCSSTRDEEKSKCYEEIIYNDLQPSTSRAKDNVDVKTVRKSELNTTPPNDLNATNFFKLLHTISIKKSHKKERDCNAQAKYILMNKEHELSDDGSIFDEEDKLSFTEN
ncbi:hypothetical protein ACFW04_001886 [Cataglyphis niger]